jgi:hypothetical protein
MGQRDFVGWDGVGVGCVCLERLCGALQLVRAACERAIPIRQRERRVHVDIVGSRHPADYGHVASSQAREAYTRAGSLHTD